MTEAPEGTWLCSECVEGAHKCSGCGEVGKDNVFGGVVKVREGRSEEGGEKRKERRERSEATAFITDKPKC